MTTSGVRLSRAVAIAATALPSPGVLCSSASAGRPEPSAWPEAIATTEPSCSASTNVRSSGSPARNGTSVEPGLEKIVVRPRRRRTSKLASLTVAGTGRIYPRMPRRTAACKA